MKENRSIRELSDGELEGVLGGLISNTPAPAATNFAVGTGVNTTAFAVGKHTSYVLAMTQSRTIANGNAGASCAIGFAFAMAF